MAAFFRLSISRCCCCLNHKGTEAQRFSVRLLFSVYLRVSSFCYTESHRVLEIHRGNANSPCPFISPCISVFIICYTEAHRGFEIHRGNANISVCLHFSVHLRVPFFCYAESHRVYEIHRGMPTSLCVSFSQCISVFPFFVTHRLTEVLRFTAVCQLLRVSPFLHASPCSLFCFTGQRCFCSFKFYTS